MLFKKSHSKIKASFIGLSFIFLNSVSAQKSSHNEEFHPYHQIGIAINHTHVFEGRDEEGKKKTLALPSWAINYTYQFHEKWGIGLHTDFIIEKFKVEKSYASNKNKDIIERSYPVAPAVMGIYKPSESWNLLLGLGGEFAKEENYLMTRAGVEYAYELPKKWEIFGSLNYDFKWNAYDSWTIGLGISKKFGQ